IWNSFIPTRIAFFIWKTVFNGISVDQNIQRRGISLASKCRCCLNSNVETFEHLLFQGDVAVNIWGYFSKALNLTPCWDMPSLHSNWLDKINLSNQFGMVSTSIAALTLWDIWLSRNSAIFAGTSMSWIYVRNQVIQGVHDLSISFNPKIQDSYINQLRLNHLGFNQIPVVVQNGTWTSWQVPPMVL
ncbi:zf-RVT domain-containing protein, partial [Cephalotus follicularis]